MLVNRAYSTYAFDLLSNLTSIVKLLNKSNAYVL